MSSRFVPTALRCFRVCRMSATSAPVSLARGRSARSRISIIFSDDRGVTSSDELSARGDRRWLYLFTGLVATLVSCAYQYGLGYLLPAFRAEGLSLPRAGLLVSAPIAGTTCGLVLAGMAADRYGEQ